MESSSEPVYSAEKIKSGFCESIVSSYTGVRRGNSGRWQAVVRNPFKKKARITLGTYDNPEEASMAVIAKKLEFSQRLKASSTESQPSLIKTERPKVVKKKVPTKCLLLGQTDAGYGDKDGTKYPEEIVRVLGQIPPIKRYKGVWRRKSGMWVSRIRDPLKNVRAWVGVFETEEEACNAYYLKKLEFEQQIIASKATDKPETPPIVTNESHSQQESSNSAIEIDDSDSDLDLDLPNSSSSTMNCNPIESSDKKVQVEDEALFLGEFSPASIMDNHGFLLDEFSCVDDLRICKD